MKYAPSFIDVWWVMASVKMKWKCKVEDRLNIFQLNINNIYFNYIDIYNYTAQAFCQVTC